MLTYKDRGFININYQTNDSFKKLNSVITKNVPYINMFVNEEDIIITCEDMSNGIKFVAIEKQVQKTESPSEVEIESVLEERHKVIQETKNNQKEVEISDIEGPIDFPNLNIESENFLEKISESVEDVDEELTFDWIDKIGEIIDGPKIQESDTSYNQVMNMSLDTMLEELSRDGEIDIDIENITVKDREFLRISAPSGLLNTLLMYNNFELEVLESYLVIRKGTTEIITTTRASYSTIEEELEILRFNDYEQLDMKYCYPMIQNMDRVIKDVYKQFIKVREKSIYFHTTDICVSYACDKKYKNVYHLNSNSIRILRRISTKKDKISVGNRDNYTLLNSKQFVAIVNKMNIDDFDMMEYIKSNVRRPLFVYNKEVDSALKIVASLDNESKLTITTNKDYININTDKIKMDIKTKTKPNKKISINAEQVMNAYKLSGSETVDLFAVDVGNNTWVTECVGNIIVLIMLESYNEI